MAVNKSNVVIEGTSGKLGNTVVFRQKGGLTILAVPPKKNNKKEPTEDDLQKQFAFTEASLYAKNAIENELLKAQYKNKAKGNQSAFNIAFKDFMKAPILHGVFTQNYTGAIGNVITFRITDVLAVVTVKVGLYTEDGVLIEEGMAVQADIKIDWNYTATVVNANVVGTVIKVWMTDTPNNTYLVERVID